MTQEKTRLKQSFNRILARLLDLSCLSKWNEMGPFESSTPLKFLYDYVPDNIKANNINTKLVPFNIKMKLVSYNMKIKAIEKRILILKTSINPEYTLR